MSEYRVPQTIPELIDLWGNTEFGRVIGMNPSAVGEMKRSGSIRPKYWPAIISDAKERRFRGITAESLMLMHVDEDAA